MTTKSKSIKNLALLLQGQFVSSFGSYVYDIAMLLWIKELTGSAAIMGLAMLLTSLPESILAPLGGTLADRFGKVKIMVVSDIISGLALFALVGVCLLSSNTLLILIALGVANLILGGCAASFIPAATSIIPSIIEEKYLEKANAAHQFSNVGASVIGQAAGGVLFAAFGAVLAFAVNAVSFAASAFSEMFIRVPNSKDKVEKAENTPKAVMKDMWQTLKRIRRTPYLFRLILYIAAFHLCLSALPVLLPFLAEHKLNVQEKWVGLFYGSYTIGILFGFIVAGSIPSGFAARHKLIALAACLTGFMFCSAALVGSIPLCLVSLVLIGTGIGVIVVNLLTELQLSSTEDERGRTMGAAQALGGSSLPIGMALFGLLLDGTHSLGIAYPSAVSGILAGCGICAVALGLSLLKMPGKQQ